MPTRDLANHPMKFSILAGRDVDTSSEEWKHECEVRFLAELPIAKRNEVFDAPGTGMKFKRNEAAVSKLRAEIDRYERLLQASPPS